MADVGLQAVDGQNDAARRCGHPPEPRGVRQRQGEELVVAVQQVPHAPQADGDAAVAQRSMDLGEAAVPGVPQRPDGGDEVEPEFVPG